MPNSATVAAMTTPAIVLTGFLGSGKTTLLNYLLSSPGLQRSAVLINEFGEVGIDHLLVERLDETTVLLNSGCICCTVRGDLVGALRGLYTKRHREEVPAFDRVLIETTGLADPAPIAHTFFSDLFVSSCYRLEAILATVDAIHAMDHLSQQPECVKQIAIADRLLVTKADLVAREDVEILCRQLRRLNAAAPIETVVRGEVKLDRVLDVGLFSGNLQPRAEEWLRHDSHSLEPRARHGHAGGEHSHLAGIDSFCAIYERPLPWHKVTAALEAVVSRHGDDVLRVKSLLNIQGEKGPVVMHGVQHLFHPPVRLSDWPSDDRRSRVVVITRTAAAWPVRAILNEHLST